jgi:tetratricopeptide (TPR) repeat protein
VLAGNDQLEEALEKSRASIPLNPDFVLGWLRVNELAESLGRDEESLRAGTTGLRLIDNRGALDIRPDAVPMTRLVLAADVDDILGDYGDEFQQARSLQSADGLRVVSENAVFIAAAALAQDHDNFGARELLARTPQLTSASTSGQEGKAVALYAAQQTRGVELLCAFVNGDWTRLLAIARTMDAEEAKLEALSVGDFHQVTNIWPYLAYAEAKTGDFTAAHALIDRTPADCGVCLRMRGNIDAAQRNRIGAVSWFAEAEKLAPSIPFAYADWGAMLLAKGDFDGAIAKFTLANARGPHFADALEMWGEALMLKNRSDLAVAKFEEANRYAPNWGRLHLKWGEALLYAGHREDARKQYAISERLDLSAADRGALSRAMAVR